MALAEIRAAIASAMTQVVNVGKVSPYEPLATREEDFKSFFLDPTLGYVLGWSITREMTSEKDRDTESNMATHLMVIRGYRTLGLAGQTEEEFQDIVEAVRTRLRREQIHQLDGEATFVGPPSVRILEPRMFGGFLVHYVEILLPVTESVLVSP